MSGNVIKIFTLLERCEEINIQEKNKPPNLELSPMPVKNQKIY